MVYFVNISKLIPELSNSTSPLSLDFFMVSYFSGSYFHVFSPMTQPRLAKALHEWRNSQNRAASYERLVVSGAPLITSDVILRIAPLMKGLCESWLSHG